MLVIFIADKHCHVRSNCNNRLSTYTHTQIHTLECAFTESFSSLLTRRGGSFVTSIYSLNLCIAIAIFAGKIKEIRQHDIQSIFDTETKERKERHRPATRCTHPGSSSRTSFISACSQHAHVFLTYVYRYTSRVFFLSLL